MKLTAFLLFTLFAMHASGLAQESPANDSSVTVTPVEYFHDPISRFSKDLWIQASSPFHMSETNVHWVGAGLVTITALLLTDQGTYNTVKDAQSDFGWVDKMSPVITEFGSKYGLGIIGAFAGYGFIANDSKAKETAYLATEVVVTSGIWGMTIKLLTSRERPTASSLPGGEWNGPFGFFRKNKDESISAFDSFPSGHTSTAFSIATVIANQYPDNIVVPIVSYTTASLVGISRITEDQHWASDVFLGAVLGYLTAQEVLAHNPSEVSRRNNGVQQVHVGWSIGMVQGTPTVHLQMQF